MRVHGILGRSLAAVMTVLALWAAVVELSGVASVVGELCVEGCEDDDASGRCDLTCDDCVCCARVRTILNAQRPSLAPALCGDALHAATARPPADPDPAEIDHVPIASSAAA